MKKALALSLGLTLVLTIACTRQTKEKPTSYSPTDKSLFDTIAKKDSLLFTAFNSRNFEAFKSYFSDELVIYQDNIGVRDYAQSMAAFKGLFEGDYVLTRELIKETLEVYPIKDFGAIEAGSHKFCHFENGKLDCGTFKFVHIWNLQNGQWKIVKIITYDHKG